MPPYLFYSVAVALLIHVTSSKLVPYERSNRELVPSSMKSSKPNGKSSGLLCGVGSIGNWRDDYQIEMRGRGELTPFYENDEPQTSGSDRSEVRVPSRIIQRLTLSTRTLRAVCPDQHTLQVISRIGDKLELTCSRLRQHLRKGNKRGFVILHRYALSRMSSVSTRGTRNESGVVLKGRAEREVGMETIDETYMCGTSFYLDGIECANADCSSLKLLCVELLVDVDLANEMFCDLLRPTQGSLLIQLSRHQERYQMTAGGSGSLLGGLINFRRSFGVRLLVGVQVLSDTEWESDRFGYREGASCPDGMFLSQVVYKRVKPGHGKASSRIAIELMQNREYEVSIRCSRLERDLSVGSPTYECGASSRNGRRPLNINCQDGFLAGLRWGDDSCPYLIIECRSLACR